MPGITWAGKTPVHWAAQNGHGDVVKLLLEQGAEKDATIKGGRTALHFAALYGQQSMVETLMGRGMDPNQKDLMCTHELSFPIVSTRILM
ncbi:hypothetical protein Poli38472_013132 [Pythium oligandrum]|uniref:Ankyrin repeat protein n=1 Tax=Pythium oligandrum TaxID=41045 RepID=A0A8K1C2G7_PYTOL|nr:hypothetical protein Poli38472_013132 [Pythium oligandrum]|eukprot:TMW55241.1 hypothetical protein Poli38472_013132 [Pythium oligandrum]